MLVTNVFLSTAYLACMHTILQAVLPQLAIGMDVQCVDSDQGQINAISYGAKYHTPEWTSTGLYMPVSVTS
jgi:hypothetical protein